MVQLVYALQVMHGVWRLEGFTSSLIQGTLRLQGASSGERPMSRCGAFICFPFCIAGDISRYRFMRSLRQCISNFHVQYSVQRL